MLDQGIRQFLDIGSGIPTVGNVHEVAHAVDPAARVLYVDHDPHAVAQSEAILAGEDNAWVARASLRQPGEVLAAAREVLDLDRPVGLLLFAVLHFLQDDEDPAGILAELTAALAPGSLLAVSHGASARPTTDEANAIADIQTVYKRSSDSFLMRSREEVAALLGGWRLVDPGVTWMVAWRPDDPADVGEDPSWCSGWGAVGRKA
jgi:trans-aconitate methyltransferase